MKKCLLLPFLLLTFYSWAQTRTLTGRVLLQADRSAVSGATVSVKNGTSVAANEQGDFTIQVPAGKTSPAGACGRFCFPRY